MRRALDAPRRAGRTAVLPAAVLPLAALLLVVLPLAGCRTMEPAQAAGSSIPPLDDVILEDIQGLIDDGKMFTAFQTIDSLQRRQEYSRIPEPQLEALRAQSLDAMVADFRRLAGEKKFGDAYRYFESLRQAGAADRLPEWSPRRLLGEVQRAYEEEGNLPLAYLLALRLLEEGEPAAEEYAHALGLAVKMGGGSVARELVSRMEAKGFEVPEEYRSLPPDPPSVASVLKGTVTIWVDRGMRIERGVGYPDRVIGSGFFIDPRGYLLTNYHVISSEVDPKYEGYSRLYIRPSEKATDRIPARVVGYDRVFDIALLKAEVDPEYVLSATPSLEVKPGESILAIGSPGGLENTVTSGIVSATGRRFLQLGDAIQVDVPLNPGNSGGPLLNAQGQLIGIVFSGIEQFEGVNFAVPFHWIGRILPDLYKGSEAVHGWLGLALQETAQGLRVIYVVPGESAERAGFREGDVLKGLDGREYSSIRDAQDALLSLSHPQLVGVDWKRGQESMRGVLELTERPFSPIETALRRDQRDRVLYPLFGIKIERSGGFLWSTDYVIKEVIQGSIADETGLSENDPLSIQGWKVDEENRYALLRLFVKRKKSGFLESSVQLAAYLETDSFL